MQPQRVMPGLVPGIHAEQGLQFWEIKCSGAAWMAGTSPAMTAVDCIREAVAYLCESFQFPRTALPLAGRGGGRR